MSDTTPLHTIPTAARAAEVAERSLYRAVDAGEIPSTSRDGTKFVALADVLVWRDARRAARPPPPAPPPPAPPPVPALPDAPAMPLPQSAATGGKVAAATGGRVSSSTPAPTIDGPLWGKLFGLLIDGQPPEQIVRQEAISPDLVELAVEKFNSLRAAGQREDALADLKRDLANLAAEVASVWFSIGAAQDSANEAVFKVPAVKLELEERLGALEQRIAQIERHLRSGAATW